MTALILFAVVLLVAVLLSELASRSVLSTSVLFLAAGVLAGPAGFGWLELAPSDPRVQRLAELALFSVLFTDGMRVGVSELTRAWHLPGRALLLGMPLALAGTAGLAHGLLGLAWPEALLLGAVLAPTDPVFAAAIVGREEVPGRLRRLLNVESGLNDGLALPAVLALLAFAGGGSAEPLRLGGELVLGVGLGIALPWAVLAIESRRLLQAHAVYEPLLAFSIALLVYALAALTHANEFLAAFAAGMTVASLSTKAREDFHRFGEVVAELLKLAALLVFGVLVTPSIVADFRAGGWLFVPLVLLLARPAAVALALAGSALDWRETLAAAWFGPKGFASLFYAFLVLDSGLAVGAELFHLVAAVFAVSIVAHSSTDVLIARWFRRVEGDERGEVSARGRRGGSPDLPRP